MSPPKMGTWYIPVFTKCTSQDEVNEGEDEDEAGHPTEDVKHQIVYIAKLL